MRRILPLLVLTLTACQAPVGLVRDRGPKTLSAFVSSLRSPSPVDRAEQAARSLAAALAAASDTAPFTSDLPFPNAEIRSVAIAADFRADHLYRRYTRPGDGVPLVVEAAPTASYHPKAGRFVPATATLKHGALHLGNPLTDPRLAADFSIPFAFHADHQKDDGRRLKGLVHADEVTPSFHIHDTYDPDKIPLVMVHGLGASPSSWNQLTNLVLGTPELRSHYQVWHYFYPTGVPFLDAAQQFRQCFQEFRTTLATESGLPEPRHPALFVTHSLGGLMVKTLASNSGDTLQHASGIETPSPALHFSTSPHVARVIFVASPLNGSSLAAIPGAEIASFIPSIPTIAEDNPVMQAFSSIPVDPSVPFHMLLGKKFALSDTLFSDGVVSFKNAALPGARSTTIVATDTHNVHMKPAALTEIRRLLYLHLQAR